MISLMKNSNKIMNQVVKRISLLKNKLLSRTLQRRAVLIKFLLLSKLSYQCLKLIPSFSPKSRSPGAISLQKSHSAIKTKHESKFVRNDKKKWVDRITGKEINFKKYLELKFYINDEEVDKNNTIYEIFSKHRAKNPRYLVCFALSILINYLFREV